MLIKKSFIGLSIYRNPEQADYTITGNIDKKYITERFADNYDIQKWIVNKFITTGIVPASEYSQLCFYSDNKQQAFAFLRRLEKFCTKVDKLFEVDYRIHK